jgi:hypothetical protein
MRNMQELLEEQKSLGTPAEMQAAAEAQGAPRARRKNNGHVHLPPNFSAFESVQQAVDLAAAQGVTVLGASNYYHYGVYADFASATRQKGIFPLFGLEVICLLDDLARAGVKVNDPGNPGKMYLCGKGITRFAPMNPAACDIIDLIWRNDTGRMARMVATLARLFESRGVATGLTLEAVKAMVVRRHGSPPETVCVQERHVAQAFQEALFARVPGPADGRAGSPAAGRAEAMRRLFGAAPTAGPDDAVAVQNDIRSHLMKAGKAAFVDEALISFDQGYRLIVELGGIPCYPTLADGASPICGYEEPVEKLIGTLKDNRIYCAEYIPIRNQPDVLTRYVKAVRAAGFVVTGGTEHNTLDLLPMEPTCLKGQPVPEDVKEIFWEGACVAAAHQFLTLHGQCGYVDGRGMLNPGYSSDEERIAAFRRLGAAVIDKYCSLSRT